MPRLRIRANRFFSTIASFLNRIPEPKKAHFPKPNANMLLPPPQEYEITVQEFDKLRSDNDTGSYRLVDCREEDEYAICRIENAELIPLSNFKAGASQLLSEEDPRPVIVYCHHGMRSLQAVSYLREKGLGKVWSLAGGIEQWSSEIDPTVPRY